MHFEEIVGVYGESLGTRIMRKFGIKYAEHHPLARPTAEPDSPTIKPALPVRDAFLAVKTVADLHAVLDEWYDPSRSWPPVPRRTGHGDLVAAGASA